MPAREDFAIEEFGGEALIVRLADMRIFRVNEHALALFGLLLDCGCDQAVALEKSRKHKMDPDPADFESVQTILFPEKKPETDNPN